MELGKNLVAIAPAREPFAVPDFLFRFFVHLIYPFLQYV
jgi:hypothetical protein